MTKKGLRSGLVIMVLLEMIFVEKEEKGVAELSWPLLSFTGSWGAELGFGLMKCGAVSQAVRFGVGLAMMKAGHPMPEDVFTEEECSILKVPFTQLGKRHFCLSLDLDAGRGNKFCKSPGHVLKNQVGVLALDSPV